MTAWPEGPVVYEVNTASLLHDVGGRSSISLAGVPDNVWDELTPPGIDAVWLMGVWERSPAGRHIALNSPDQLASMRTALADLGDDDVIGSAYCVRSYVVDDRFGGRAGLAAARSALSARGVRLLVDFVPNHVAPDHDWLADHPGYFVQGDESDLANDPESFLAVGDAVIARGRDPYFAPWPDVAQLNAFDRGMREATIATLIDIGDQADGVRCDMAMLLLDDVFARTWGDRAGPPLADEFWSEVIGAVRRAHPGFLFVAEAYWDLESRLQQLGFDHCYDKRLYDRLVGAGPAEVRAHLGAPLEYQRGLLRFLENHDEPRAARVFDEPAERAAAVIVATLPGATLWHEGQFEGRRVRLPVFLRRRPAEPLDDDLRRFHLRLLEAAAAVRHGEWSRAGATGWPDNQTCEHVLTWCWTADDRRSLVVVNDSDHPASARVRAPWPDLAGRTWHLGDLLSGDEFLRDGDELAESGLFVSLAPWGFHVLIAR